MELADRATMSDKHPNTSEETTTRLSGRWLFLARATWVILVVFALMVPVAGIPQFPAFFRHIQQPCIGEVCARDNGQLSLSAQLAFARLGISPSMYALFAVVTVAFIPALVWMLVGMILFWRKSDDWMALLTSLFLLCWGASFATGLGNFLPSTQLDFVHF